MRVDTNLAPHVPAIDTGGRQLLLFACIFIAGAAGLVYEVIWSRQLTLLVGTSAHAHAAVLTAYMFGLGLGSYTLGRVVDRLDNEIRLYGIMELCIGCLLYTSPSPRDA